MCIVTLLIFLDYLKAQPFSASDKGPFILNESCCRFYSVLHECIQVMHICCIFFHIPGASIGSTLFRGAAHPFLPVPFLFFYFFYRFHVNWIQLNKPPSK